MICELFDHDELIEVFVDASLSECQWSNREGLYSQELRGEISNCTWISSPYEASESPDVRFFGSTHTGVAASVLEEHLIAVPAHLVARFGA